MAQIAVKRADVLIYLTRLTAVVGVDLNHAVASNLAADANKYPVDEAKGFSARYTEFQNEQPSSDSA